MRRWNGWGDDSNDLDYQVKPEGERFIKERLGDATPLPDASLDSVLAQVPDSRMPEHALIKTDKETRVRHARGQSLPDWLAMRSGDFGRFPDGVAFPESTDEVVELMRFAQDKDIMVIPYGGGTSVAGHINPPESERPVLTISLGSMNKLMSLDTESNIATFGAGAAGPELERALAERGYTLGHYPQSWELSTVGGWVASRSSGQQSLRYGRIEQMFAGGTVVTSEGIMDIPSIPASSAGPDLREIFMGSEGRMGIITEVQVRVLKTAPQETFHVAFISGWEQAKEFVRTVTQQKIQLSMLRLSNPVETDTHLMLAGHDSLIGMLKKYLNFRGVGEGRCMVTYGLTGTPAQCRAAQKQTRSLLRQYRSAYLGKLLGDKWEHSRFRSPYLRHGLWDRGYVVDTMETSVNWNKTTAYMNDLEDSLRNALAEFDEKVHVFTHLSHMYVQGSSIYTTYVFRTGDNYEETLARWTKLKSTACDVIVKHGGTISHQHGVGKDHAPYMSAEKGELGMGALKALANHFDPDQRMNTGTLLEDK